VRPLVLKKWMPLKHLLHSGFHNVVSGQEHAHPSEWELVFGHPEGRIKLQTKEICTVRKVPELSSPGYDHYNVQPAKVRQPKKLAKAEEFDPESPRGFIQPDGTFHPIPEETYHHEWIGKQMGAPDEDDWDDAYARALDEGWMGVGIGHGHNVQARARHLQDPNHPATRVLKYIAKKHWGPTFEAICPEDPKRFGKRSSTKDFVGRGALVPAKPTMKSEDLAKAMFKETAFRHFQTGQIAPSGPFHDADNIPADPDGFVITRDWEHGFLDHAGKFYNRQEAAQRANSAL